MVIELIKAYCLMDFLMNLKSNIYKFAENTSRITKNKKGWI